MTEEEFKEEFLANSTSVLNIGSSTTSEIGCVRKHGKCVRLLEEIEGRG